MPSVYNNYQPDNKLFKYIVLSALSFIAGIWYAFIKILINGDLQWYDWFLVALISLVMTGYFYLKIHKYRY